MSKLTHETLAEMVGTKPSLVKAFSVVLGKDTDLSVFGQTGRDAAAALLLQAQNGDVIVGYEKEGKRQVTLVEQVRFNRLVAASRAPVAPVVL